MKLYIFMLFITCLLSEYLSAKDQRIEGKIVDNKNQPIAFVFVFNKIDNKYTYTDAEGRFSILVNSFPAKLEFSILGYRDKIIDITTSKKIQVKLEEESLQLAGVIVTAKINSSNNGTSTYKINNEAIKQVQAMTLGDILAILPGNKISPPNMTSVQQFNTRTAGYTMSEAFSSKVLIDGISLSNDANLQAYNPAQGISGGKSTVGRGIDLRTITPENIESVEVISGVPSVKYGNIASGAVIIKRKITPQDLTITTSFNTTNYQIGIHQGLQLKNENVLSYNISGTHATLSPTQRKDYYQSIMGTLIWRTTFSKQLNWLNTISVDGSYALNSKDFEDEDVFKNDEELRIKTISASMNGNLDLGAKINYSISTNIKEQYSLHDTQENNGPLPLVEGLETGTYKVPFSPFSYRLKTEILGQPINFQTQVNAEKLYKWDKFQLMNKAGLQFSFDKNMGEGRIGGKSIVGKTGAIGSRAAKFKNIPALKIWSSYYETKNTYLLSDKSYFALTAGLRYDNINAKYHLLSPRFSLDFQFSKLLKLRGAWGISYKAPALIHLYPGPTYIDFTNMSFFSQNKKERMGLITTTKITQRNEQLKPIKGKTVEIGFDLNLAKYGQLRITAFDKKLEDGIINSPELLILSKQAYEIKQRYPDRMPDVSPIAGKKQKIMLTYNRMKNDIQVHTIGAEIVFNSEKISATETSFDFQLSFLKTQTKNNAYKLVNSQYTLGEELARIGVYERPTRIDYKGIGSFTIIQHIPALKLLFTLRTELNFYDYYSYTSPSIYPRGYYTRENKYIPLSENERKTIANKDLVLPKNEYERSMQPPFYPNFHLQARKELKGGSSLQFYVQNFLWYTPSYTDKEIRTTLNSDIYFGLGLTINL